MVFTTYLHILQIERNLNKRGCTALAWIFQGFLFKISEWYNKSRYLWPNFFKFIKNLIFFSIWRGSNTRIALPFRMWLNIWWTTMTSMPRDLWKPSNLQSAGVNSANNWLSRFHYYKWAKQTKLLLVVYG